MHLLNYFVVLFRYFFTELGGGFHNFSHCVNISIPADTYILKIYKNYIDIC